MTWFDQILVCRRCWLLALSNPQVTEEEMNFFVTTSYFWHRNQKSKGFKTFP
jgi:hypothetical protein